MSTTSTIAPPAPWQVSRATMAALVHRFVAHEATELEEWSEGIPLATAYASLSPMVSPLDRIVGRLAYQAREMTDGLEGIPNPLERVQLLVLGGRVLVVPVEGGEDTHGVYGVSVLADLEGRSGTYGLLELVTELADAVIRVIRREESRPETA